MAKMTKKNGFVIFMEARRPALLAAGHNLANGMRDLVGLCGDDWAALPDPEKRRYNDIARQQNEQKKRESEVKLPIAALGSRSAGARVPNSPQQNGDARRASNSTRGTVGAFAGSVAMLGSSPSPKKQTIKSDNPFYLTDEDYVVFEANQEIVDMLFEEPGWIDQPIVICSFNMYVQPDHNVLFLPAEIGLTAMTLRAGVVDNFARIIDPGEVPKGHGVEASRTAVEYGLPQFGKHPELADHMQLVKTLKRFLRKYQGGFRGSDLYVFAFESDFLMVSRCMQWLLEKTERRLPVKVLSLDQYVWKATCSTKRARDFEGRSIESFIISGDDPKECEATPYRTLGQSLSGSFIYSSSVPTSIYGVFTEKKEVEKCIKGVDNYKYYNELCCIYHYKSGIATENCALNTSNRYAFSILEILTLSNKIKIIPGGHYPETDEPDVEHNRRVRMLSNWGLTTLEKEMEIQQHKLPPFPESERDRRRREARSRRSNGVRGENARSPVGEQENTRHVGEGREYVGPVRERREYARPVMEGREYARPVMERREYARPVMEGREYARPVMERREYARPVMEGREYTRPVMEGREYTRPDAAEVAAARQRLQNYQEYYTEGDSIDEDTSNPYSGSSVPSIFWQSGSSTNSQC